MTNSMVGSLEILGVRDAGNLDKERLLLRAVEPLKTEYYLVVNARSSGDKLTILNDKVFWFPVVQVNAGEYVRVFTKKGSYQRLESTFGDLPAIYHDFYWNQEKPICDNVNANAVTLFRINTWGTAFPTT